MSRILIVEDEFDLRETLDMFLTHVGFQVDSTSRVAAALEKLQDDGYDCVLLDLMLPDGNGSEVLDAIRADDELRHLPVIIMSAIPPLQPTAAQREVPFLQKPFSFKALQATLADAGVTP